MTEAPRLLLVDDEPAVLDALRRTHRRRYDLTTALGATEGLETVRNDRTFDVVVSDYQMPEMNGAVFLSEVANIAPDCMRVMLTGNADLQTAIDAVNTGNVFRFLTKPCDPEVFVQCIEAATDYLRLRRAEKELLEGTLKGSIEVLSEVLSLCDPEAFGRANRVRQYVQELQREMGQEPCWQVESAALLSQIGCVALPRDLLERVAQGQALTPEQSSAYETHPEISARLLERIPRLDEVAEMVRLQNRSYSEVVKEPGLSGKVKSGSQVLAASLEFDKLIGLGARKVDALRSMIREPSAFSATVLKALTRIEPLGSQSEARMVTVAQIREGMIMGQDVRGRNGTLIVARGHVISAGLVERLTKYHQLRGVDEPIRILDAPSDGKRGSSAA